MTITLPAELDSFLQSEVAAGRYPTVTDALRDAVERLRCLRETEELRGKVDAGLRDLDEGRFTEVRSSEEAAALRSRILEKATERAASSKGA